jgi:hypothetical protein
MRSKLFVAALLLVAIGTAGMAHAQPSVHQFNVKKDGVKYFNVEISGSKPLMLEVLMKSSNTDVDIYLFEKGADTDDPDEAFAKFQSTAGGYEAATISAVNGKTIVVCIVHISGPNSKGTLVSSVKGGTDIESGNVRLGFGSSLTDGGDFDLYGPVSPELAGIQSTLQDLVAQKR